MWLGRFFVGDFVPLLAVCRNSTLTEVAPTAAPVFNVYKANDTPITGADDVSMPPFKKGVITGWFLYELRLGSEFSAGRYHVLITYTHAGGNAALQHSFEVTAGGHSSGAYLAVAHADFPHNDFVIGQLDADSLEFRKRPRV